MWAHRGACLQGASKGGQRGLARDAGHAWREDERAGAPLGCTHAAWSPLPPTPALPAPLSPQAGTDPMAACRSVWESSAATSMGFATVALRSKPPPAAVAPGPAAATACNKWPSSTEFRPLNCLDL